MYEEEEEKGTEWERRLRAMIRLKYTSDSFLAMVIVLHEKGKY